MSRLMGYDKPVALRPTHDLTPLLRKSPTSDCYGVGAAIPRNHSAARRHRSRAARLEARDRHKVTRTDFHRHQNPGLDPDLDLVSGLLCRKPTWTKKISWPLSIQRLP